MEAPQSINSSRIAWLIGAFFLLWSAFAVVAGFPGNESWRALFSPICHQIPDRCFAIGGHPIALCVRCFCIYLGLAAGHPLFAVWRPKEKVAVRLLYVACALMAADVAFETVGVYGDIPLTRAITGGLFGLVCSRFTLQGLTELLSKPTLQRIPYEHH